MNDLHKTVSANLRKIRLEKGYTQEQIAEFVNVSRVSIANIEIGNQKATLKMVNDFILKVGCKVTDIFPQHTNT